MAENCKNPGHITIYKRITQRNKQYNGYEYTQQYHHEQNEQEY